MVQNMVQNMVQKIVQSIFYPMPFFYHSRLAAIISSRAWLPRAIKEHKKKINSIGLRDVLEVHFLIEANFRFYSERKMVLRSLVER